MERDKRNQTNETRRMTRTNNEIKEMDEWNQTNEMNEQTNKRKRWNAEARFVRPISSCEYRINNLYVSYNAQKNKKITKIK